MARRTNTLPKRHAHPSFGDPAEQGRTKGGEVSEAQEHQDLVQ